MDPGKSIADFLCSWQASVGEGGPRLRVRKTVWHHSKNRVAPYGRQKLQCFDVSQKVWVGGLTDEVTWKDLQELADTVGKGKWVEILGKGQACVCYGTASEAQTAIAILNGNASLQFDVWTKKVKA